MGSESARDCADKGTWKRTGRVVEHIECPILIVQRASCNSFMGSGMSNRPVDEHLPILDVQAGFQRAVSVIVVCKYPGQFFGKV